MTAAGSVLVVDDLALNRKLMRVVLEHGGYTVRTAESALEALEILESWKPDVVLVDVQLRGMDGLALTRRIKSAPHTRDLCVVVISAHAMAEHRALAMEAGCAAFMSRPVGNRALLQVVADRTLRPSH